MVVAKTLEALLEPDLEPEAELIAMMTSVAFLAPRTTSRASPETSKAVLESVGENGGKEDSTNLHCCCLINDASWNW
ncbi:hypothetical protein F442_19577 [Phytophthora nicotianae P10297]|uniref:Uncharacterized protein n=1 Tax=Phytophthora nicotianae P10297 TaxID=1317064 RepID=W2YBG5_PHYNI|nr:hypothetical protein F442_19577 [Phytophthora nicotianae P10297]